MTIELGSPEQQRARAMSAFLSPRLISNTAQHGPENEHGDLALGELLRETRKDARARGELARHLEKGEPEG